MYTSYMCGTAKCVLLIQVSLFQVVPNKGYIHVYVCMHVPKCVYMWCVFV